MDHDGPDDSNKPRHTPDSVAEETSAAGQRGKGEAKKVVGEAIGDDRMADKGARENQAGKDRQRRNNAV
jgi:uncharacterized protein YjbJ (UPF0337 family)